jgi:hypothetical protein
MKTWLKILILTVVITLPAFMAGPNAPLGGFWGADPHAPQPAPSLLPGFMVLGLLDALFLGLGVSFLVFGYPVVRDLAGHSGALTRLTHLGISWIMIQWWAHSNLHIVSGEDFARILAIDYGFHVTIMLSTVAIVAYFIRVAGQRRAVGG